LLIAGSAPIAGLPWSWLAGCGMTDEIAKFEANPKSCIARTRRQTR
jgi:hypothetical protein